MRIDEDEGGLPLLSHRPSVGQVRKIQIDVSRSNWPKHTDPTTINRTAILNISCLLERPVTIRNGRSPPARTDKPAAASYLALFLFAFGA